MTFLEKKILNYVFDEKTLLTIKSLINLEIIKEIYGPVSTGKEAVVFGGLAERPIAIKVYKIETSNYRKMVDYLRSDPRFPGVRKDKRSIVCSFAKKEYRNLLRAYESGAYCPRPRACRNNVLVMDFIGIDNEPAPRLKDCYIKDLKKVYDSIIESVKNLYTGGLVHADLSEYNILLSDKPYLIDFSQAVLKQHPNSEEFLRRDVVNITNFFEKRGLKTEREKALKTVKSSGK